MTLHNEAKVGEIAKNVIMAGDPLRVKYIADKYLENAKVVNQVRGMYCYTGAYEGKEISVMAHGMGIPSMGIYSYELYHFYDVDTIIRIGSCGAISDKLRIKDLILVEKSYTEGNYGYNFDNKEMHIVESNQETNSIIEKTAKEKEIKLIKGTTLCNECFDLYLPNQEALIERAPKGIELLASEMEAFALFYNAKREGKKASCLLTVTDEPRISKGMTSEEREKTLNTMIELALDSIIKLKQ